MTDAVHELTDEECKELELFSSVPASPLCLSLDPDTDCITVAAIASQSGDREVVALPGAISPREVARKTFELNPEWWGSPGEIDIDDYGVYVIASSGS